MLQSNTKRIFLCCCLIISSALFVTLPAFAATSIKYVWIALDASEKPFYREVKPPTTEVVGF